MINFEKAYKQLNPEQKEAVDTIDGPVIVIAGPGSGKSQLLSLRVANILKNTDTLPEQILCLTYTEAACKNMHTRLLKFINKDAYKVRIHTYHSFATSLINNYSEYFFNSADYSVLEDITKIEIMEEILQNLDYDNPLKSQHPSQGYVFLKSILETIGMLKSNGINPLEFEYIITQNQDFLEKSETLISSFFDQKITLKIINQIPDLIQNLQEIEITKPEISLSSKYYKFHTQNLNISPLKDIFINKLTKVHEQCLEDKKTGAITKFKSEFTKKDDNKNSNLKDFLNLKKMHNLAKIYLEYQEKLHSLGKYDFDDMIINVNSVLEENPSFALEIQEKILYILVDEFQDTNQAQLRLIYNLLNLEITNYKPNILVVGDDDQSIYKFQGANLENLIDFSKHFPEVKEIFLKYNYRSTQNILDLAKIIISQSDTRFSDHLGINKELVAFVGG